jgi:hypothetical protein
LIYVKRLIFYVYTACKPLNVSGYIF